MHRFVLLSAVIALCACGESSSTEPTPTPPSTIPPVTAEPGRYVSPIFSGVTVTPNIVYGSSVPFGGSAPTNLILDVYEPTGDTASARPAVVLIHGGGFTVGNRVDGNIVDLCRRYAQLGYVTVTIEYRLRTDAQVAADAAGTIRDAVDDGKAAVRWLRANAAARRIDVNRIAVAGASAGAYTALGVAYYEGEGSSGNAGFSSEVRAVVDFWGGMIDHNQLEAGEAPVIIIHGTVDATVPYSQATAINARALAVGVRSELHTMTGAGHTYWLPLNDYVLWTGAFLRTSLSLP